MKRSSCKQNHQLNNLTAQRQFRSTHTKTESYLLKAHPRTHIQTQNASLSPVKALWNTYMYRFEEKHTDSTHTGVAKLHNA